jgi:hypothetical protein
MAAMVGATPRALLRRFSGVSARSKFGALQGGPTPVKTAP